MNNLLEALTEKTVSVANIEQVNFSRAAAKMSEGEGGPLITMKYGDITDGTYMLAEAPPDDCLTVRRAVLDILGQIDLQKLCVNIEAAAALIDVAYNACNGIYGAHQNLYKLRTDIYEAVCESVGMSADFKNTSNLIIQALVSVYESLSSVDNCDIDIVKLYLSKVTATAKGMAQKADAMSKRFTELEKRTLNEGQNVVAVENEDIKQRELLTKQLADFKAQLDAFNASKKQLEKQISEVQTLYTKYDDEARKLNEKANTMEIVGMVVGGLGQVAGCVSSAVSGYYGAQTPKININSTPQPQSPEPTQQGGTKTGGNTGTADPSKPVAKPEPTAPPADTADVAARKTRLGSNQAELEVLKLRLPDYEKKIAELENEKKLAEKARTDKEIDTEIKETSDKRATDTQRKIVLEKEISDDDTYLKAKLASSLGTTVSDISKELEAKFDNVGNNARSAAAAKDKLAEEMLRLKFELEEKNTENMARIAEFTQKIKNANIDIIDLSVVINSLQLAVTCLSTVGATLATVALFWSSVERACANLASNTTIEALNLTIDAKQGNPESLVKYITTNATFGKNWFIMESQWQAMYLVCNAYYLSCNNAKATLDISFCRAEDDPRAHWKLAQQMAKELEEKLSVTLRCEQSKNADFKKRVELAQSEKEKMLAEF